MGAIGHIAGVTVLAALAGAGQPQYGQPSSNLRPIESGTESSPLSRDLRSSQIDLRRPSAFDRVYEVRVGPGRTVKYARVDGALVAVFDRGAYEASMRGEVPLIPPGTTFMIGDPERLFAPPAASAPRHALSERVDYWAGADGALSLREPTEPEKAKTVPPPTMWTSEMVRRERIGSLLDLAWKSR